MSKRQRREAARQRTRQQQEATLILHGWCPIQTIGGGHGVFHRDHGLLGRTVGGNALRNHNRYQATMKCGWEELNSYRVAWLVRRLEAEGLI
jgi:hypothetical protein